ncbi:MAG: lipid-A-disaccharide synthase-related protein [Thermostichales cyanobacterium HHBFW_bins_127]
MTLATDYQNPGQRLLLISNGHGEDLNAAMIGAALQGPDCQVDGMALVGSGLAYRQRGIPLIAPTRALPSGGFVYMHPWQLLRDVVSGLIPLLWQQWQAIRHQGSRYDLVVGVGDVYPLVLAALSGRPYVAFLISTSSYYEGRIRLPWLSWWLLRSRRCLRVLTRDAFTAKDLQQRGLAKADYVGTPLLDALSPGNQPLPRREGIPILLLLPGSRLPEALENLRLLLRACELAGSQYCYWVALVAEITPRHLSQLDPNWTYVGERLVRGEVAVQCLWGQFGNALAACDCVLGMAGTAVEQAVGLGKPVLQIPGKGPQFTYRFAEAQQRLLGCSVQTFRSLPQLVAAIPQVLQDPAYQERCRRNGQERLGSPGGTARLAAAIREALGGLP